MNTVTELDTTQNKEEYIDCDDQDRHVQPVPAGTPVWVGPHPHQHPLQPGVVDLTLRSHSPRQSTPYQMTYPDCLLEPEYHLLTAPVPGPSDSSHHSSAPAPWFYNVPTVCNMMPGDLHVPLSSLCVPQVMDCQQFQDGLTEFHLPVLGNVSGSGQFMLVNPCEPRPVFFTQEPAPTHTHDDVSVSATPSQLLQYHQATCPLYESRVQTANTQPQAPPAQTAGASKPCHCTKSNCLKLYCKCFANGAMCSNCDCSNCHNNAEHEMQRHQAVQSCLDRNPDAFRSKVAGWESGEVKGCTCKRSNCLKNYCECYQANIMCTSSCKCVGCRNYDDGSQMGLREETGSVENKPPASVVTTAVVEAACNSLLVQAEMADREAQSPAQAERMVLEEFGRCLSQIVQAMFKNDDIH